MPNCSVKICKNRSFNVNFKTNGITYHVFPKNGIYKEKWIDATGNAENWFPTKNSTICSEHFEEKCFQPLEKRRFLFPDSVPTLKLRLVYETTSTENTPTATTTGGDTATENICFPTCVIISSTSIASTQSIDLDTSVNDDKSSLKIETIEVTPTTTLPEEKALLGTSNDTPRIKKLCQDVAKRNRLLKIKTLKIKALQASNRRLKKKVASLIEILNELENNSLISPDLYTYMKSKNLLIGDLTERCKAKPTSKKKHVKKRAPVDLDPLE